MDLIIKKINSLDVEDQSDKGLRIKGIWTIILAAAVGLEKIQGPDDETKTRAFKKLYIAGASLEIHV